MPQPGRRSRHVQSRVGCSANRLRPRLGGISHRKTGAALPAFVEFERGAWLAVVKLELARALRQFLLAPNSREACRVVVRNPILLVESAPELLRAVIEEAERRGDADDKEMLAHYLRVLELARETSVVRAGSDADQPGC